LSLRDPSLRSELALREAKGWQPGHRSSPLTGSLLSKYLVAFCNSCASPLRRLHCQYWKACYFRSGAICVAWSLDGSLIAL